MRTFAWAAAAVAVALTTGCKDRHRDDTGERVEAAGDSAGAAVREGATDVGNTVDTAADKVGDAARSITGNWSYERRDEFRQEVRTRLDALDRKLADARKSVNKDASETYAKGVAAARETRTVVGRDLERLGKATETSWDELRDDLQASLDSLDRQIRALQPDAKPMGGAGPS
jgi:hypothetical protein